MPFTIFDLNPTLSLMMKISRNFFYFFLKNQSRRLFLYQDKTLVKAFNEMSCTYILIFWRLKIGIALLMFKCPGSTVCNYQTCTLICFIYSKHAHLTTTEKTAHSHAIHRRDTDVRLEIAITTFGHVVYQ